MPVITKSRCLVFYEIDPWSNTNEITRYITDDLRKLKFIIFLLGQATMEIW